MKKSLVGKNSVEMKSVEKRSAEFTSLELVCSYCTDRGGSYRGPKTLQHWYRRSARLKYECVITEDITKR